MNHSTQDFVTSKGNSQNIKKCKKKNQVIQVQTCCIPCYLEIQAPVVLSAHQELHIPKNTNLNYSKLNYQTVKNTNKQELEEFKTICNFK